MFIGVYICLGVIFIIISLFIFPAIRDKPAKLILLSITFMILGLALLELASGYLGFVQLGSPAYSNIPGDFLGKGLLGWIILILPILAVISPLLISFWFHKSSDRNDRSISQ